MPFDCGVIAQKPHRRLFIGGQLREHHQVSDAGLGRQVGEMPLLLFGPFRGRRDQIGPPGTVERRGHRCRVVKVGDRKRNPGGEPAAVRLRAHHGPHRRGLDVWHATTTLHATVAPLDPYPALVPAARAHSSGTMRLRFPDFLREMRSLHPTGTSSRIESARTVQRFLTFWAGAVLRAFTSPGGDPGPTAQAAVSQHREVP